MRVKGGKDQVISTDIEDLEIRLLQYDLRAIEDNDRLIGVDESGRGALAGPVVAAAVCLDKKFYDSEWCKREAHAIEDSKQLSAVQRENLFAEFKMLKKKGLIDAEVGIASVEQIEKHNILGATRIAMQQAVEGIASHKDNTVSLPSIEKEDNLFHEEVIEGDVPPSRICIMVDGRPLRPFPYSHVAVVAGDAKSLVIAMASIIAKVTRDTLMMEIDRNYPQYGFAHHKGYGTTRHQAAILNGGSTPVHRVLFLRKLFKTDSQENQAVLELIS